MADLQHRHWWYQGRRAILETLLQRQAPPAPRSIVEIGCGPGGNLAMLAAFGPIAAIESSARARALVPAEYRGRVREGALPDRLSIEARSADWVCLFDVLEHIDDDVAALRACGELLSPRGAVLVTVPAYPSLWSEHDRLHHHKRRYTRDALAAAATQAGLRVEYWTAFNTVLLPLAVVARWRDQGSGRVSGLDVPAPWLNALLRAVFASERAWLRWGRLPAGLSLFARLSRA